jgi:putative peptidoglycan lipid II flippase
MDDPHAPAHTAHARALSSAVRVVSSVTFLSRIGGLVRDVLLVRVFGDTAIGSAFTAGFAIPNMFRRLFGEGALSAAFIPEYTAAEGQDAGEAARLASLTVWWLAISTGLLTAVIELGLMGALLWLPANPDRELSIRLIMLMLPFMPFICIAAILAGMLQVHGRFGPAASGPLVLNGFIIAVGLWHEVFGGHGGQVEAYALGAATVLSGLTQSVWFAILLRRDVQWTRAFGDAGARAWRMLKRMLPVLIGLGTLQVNAFIDTAVAMWPIWIGPTLLGMHYPLDKSSGIILSASQRLYQFPLGVFGIAVATAAFPMLSRHAGNGALFGATLRRGVRLSLYIGLPASAGLMLVRGEIVPVLYRSGEAGFSEDGVARAALVVLGYAPGIWAYSLNQILTRAFYARGDTSTPMRVAVAMVALNFLLNISLIWPLGEGGLAWSTSICAAIQCLVLARMCRRLMPPGERVFDGPTSRAAGRIALVSAAMSAAVLAVGFALPHRESWPWHVGALGLLTAVGAATYLGGSVALGLPEVRWLLGREGGGPVGPPPRP